MSRPDYIPSLDGLRGVAALLVVGAHIGLIFPITAPHLVTMGDEAVGLFFALSGFLMAHLYGSRPVTRENVLDFLVSRFARIYPVYLVAVVLVAMLSSMQNLDFVQPIVSGTDFVRHVFLLGSSGVFWSIPPEIQFYLLFPVLWLCLAQPQRYSGMIVGLAVVVVVDGLVELPGPGIVLVSKLPYFLFGALAGVMHSHWNRWIPSALTGILTLFLLAVFFTYRHILPGFSPEFWGLQSAVAAAVIVGLVARQPPIAADVLAAAPVRFLGKISFSLYLFHVPIMFLARLTFDALMPEPALIVMTLCIAVVGTWFIHETIEVPGRRLLVLIWQDNRWRLVSRETPVDQMDRAILGLQEIEKRLGNGATSAMADQRQISATAEPWDGGDGTVIQDDRNGKLRA
ncbi:acyltransferase family protein [Rhizobium leguminosarum]|uniref:acyltransferase family protein n=1 Tax=Rhizobium leguminosarum TaxID=384 RepID=UPI0014423748|nr:acyltransferase [Rhizobium leguminosarum]NKK64417.1 acyltransferase family protein [Rhizobium leguminosarum bv. viciae]NKL06964.1 acyltransferase family protein [Rhizobium leguminosarum bv. viciae]NKL85753.1 acyltransferase family protein [Rhizobium leguminosarum bv. viciae]NKL91383.1 acyltransferase family protein [Rhizobium leguminosarum bv. viciae]NKM91706.1 acyltransferase family protein [Rhizobium leguminosarum bv. viciae]